MACLNCGSPLDKVSDGTEEKDRREQWAKPNTLLRLRPVSGLCSGGRWFAAAALQEL